MKALFSLLGRVIDAVRVFVGRLVFVLMLLLLLVLLFARPGAPQLPSEAALVLAPSGAVSEQLPVPSPADLLLGPALPSSSVLQDMVTAVIRGATDDRIRALVIDTRDLLSISPAQMETLGNALELFRDSGKPIYAYGESFNQQQYALASYADSIMLHPMGSVMINGFGGSQLFFRDLLDRLNINVHIFRVGEFKSASEPFTRMDMSEEARTDAQALVNSLWTRYVDKVAANRQITPEELQAYSDNFAERLVAAGGDMARLAFESGLVDNIAAADSFRRQVAATVGVENGTFRQVHFEDYLYATAPAPAPTQGQVGVIVVQGTIMPGESGAGMAGADSIVELVRMAQADDRIRSVVVRVDSPGGSALASEEMRAALAQLQQSGKPVVISMGGTAASGGYWISATADEIWASASTVTGSIGVVGIIPTFEDALDYLGIGVDGVGTTELSRSGDALTGMDQNVQTIYQASVEDAYRRFLQLVSDGRNMSVVEVDRIGQGRVWTGEQALEVGLVDQLGDLEQAIASAAQMAGLDNWEHVYLQRPLTPGEEFLMRFMDTVGASQVVSSWKQSMVRSWASYPDSALNAVLTSLPQPLRQQWQAMMNLLLPSQHHASDRLRMITICDTCLGLK